MTDVKQQAKSLKTVVVLYKKEIINTAINNANPTKEYIFFLFLKN